MLWLVLAMLILGAWGLWFILGQVSSYEVSSILSVNKAGMVVAEYPRDEDGRIWEGQSATLRLDVMGEDGRPLNVPAIVMKVVVPETAEPIKVELAPLELADLPPQANLKGRVEIEVERVSPATLILRASGNFPDDQQSPLNPQRVLGGGLGQ